MKSQRKGKGTFPQIERLIAIAAGAGSPGGISSREVREQFGVGPRTITRDIGFIRDRLNVDIEYSPTEYRFKARNVEQVLPLVKTLSRFF